MIFFIITIAKLNFLHFNDSIYLKVVTFFIDLCTPVVNLIKISRRPKNDYILKRNRVFIFVLHLNMEKCPEFHLLSTFQLSAVATMKSTVNDRLD